MRANTADFRTTAGKYGRVGRSELVMADHAQTCSVHMLALCSPIYTGGSYTGTNLIKDVSDIGFRLSKPHGQQLWALDGDEVGLTLIGNSFGQQCFTTARRTIEQYTLGRGHAELEELLWVLHWVLVNTANTVTDQ